MKSVLICQQQTRSKLLDLCAWVPGWVAVTESLVAMAPVRAETAADVEADMLWPEKGHFFAMPLKGGI